MGGYECADHINYFGERANLLFETMHPKKALEDYKLLELAGIKTVREGICWSRVETKPFQYDFSEVKNRLNAAAKAGIQTVWDICHFGFPDDLIPAHPKFALRFSALCTAFARVWREHTDEPLIVTPINEISFLSWLGGDARGTVPFAVHSGADVKYHLCKAAIAGIKAFKTVDPACRILLVEPLIKIHAMPGEVNLPEVYGHNESQFEAMDIIGGRKFPELGGDESFLDILGFNYYYNNQWEHNGRRLNWPENISEIEPLSELLQLAYKRYNRPMILSETGHFDDLRAEWFEYALSECLEAINAGVDLRGVCHYPILGRMDWDFPDKYNAAGLWDVDNPAKERIAYEPLLQVFRRFNEVAEGRMIINL